MKLCAAVAISLLGCGCARQRGAFHYTPSVFETQVKNAVRVGDGDAAVQALRQRLMASPRDIGLRRTLAGKFDEAGHPDLALEHLRIAHEYDPEDEGLTLELARKLVAVGFRGQANGVLSATITAREPGAELLSALAIVKDELGLLREGEGLHRRALALDACVRLRNNLAFNLARQKRAGEAEEIFQRILREKPSHEVARNNLAMLYATQLNRPAEALLHWAAVSGPAAAHNNLAAIYLEQNRDSEARLELEKALALRGRFPEAMRNLQILAERTGGTVKLDRANLDPAGDKRSWSLSKSLDKTIRRSNP